MATYGIVIYNATSATLFDSRNFSRYFHIRSVPSDSYTNLNETLSVTIADTPTYIYKYYNGVSNHQFEFHTAPTVFGGIVYNPSVEVTFVRTGGVMTNSFFSVPVTNVVDSFAVLSPPVEDYGFICSGSDGLLQISDEYRHLTLITSGTATASVIPVGNYYWGDAQYSSGATLGGAVTLTFPPQDTPPLIFITQSSGWISIESFVFTNSQCTGVIIVSERTLNPNNGTSWGTPTVQTTVTFDYYVYSRVSSFADANDKYGIAVYDPNGEKIFDQSTYPLKIVGAYQMSLSDIVATGAWTNNGYSYYNEKYYQYTNTSTYKAAICLNPFQLYTGALLNQRNYVNDIFFGSMFLYGDFIKVTDGKLSYNCKWSGCLSTITVRGAANSGSIRLRENPLPFLVAQVSV